MKTLIFKNYYIEQWNPITSVKPVIITQLSNIKSQYNQFSPIEQNPQFFQEHINPNFKIFEEIMKFLKLKHENHVYMMHEQKTVQKIGSNYSKSPKTLNFL